MLDRGRGEAEDFPGYFSSRCLHFRAFLAAVNEELTALLYRRQYNSRIQDSRAAVCRQYGQLSALLGAAAAELGEELIPDPAADRRLRQRLAGMGDRVRGGVFRDGRGRLRIELEGPDCPLLAAPEELAELAAAQEAAKAAAAPAPAPAKPEPAAEPIRHEPEVDFETFCRVEMLVGQVTACENMKESKKLLKLTVFDGERERTILSGIAKWYKPEDLAGKKVGIVANLAPRPMMGGKYVSEGMVLAADTAVVGASVVFFPDDVPTGMRIH